MASGGSNWLWPRDFEELTLDYLERYAFEHADVQLSLSQDLLDYARSIDWKVRPDAQVIGNPVPDASEPQPSNARIASYYEALLPPRAFPRALFRRTRIRPRR